MVLPGTTACYPVLEIGGEYPGLEGVKSVSKVCNTRNDEKVESSLQLLVVVVACLLVCYFYFGVVVVVDRSDLSSYKF